MLIHLRLKSTVKQSKFHSVQSPSYAEIAWGKNMPFSNETIRTFFFPSISLYSYDQQIYKSDCIRKTLASSICNSDLIYSIFTYLIPIF